MTDNGCNIIVFDVKLMISAMSNAMQKFNAHTIVHKAIVESIKLDTCYILDAIFTILHSYFK